jgi:hypothetical protein
LNADFSSYFDFKTLTGAIIGASLVWLGEFIKSKHNQSKDSHYLAVRLIPILEQFLDGCFDVSADDGVPIGVSPSQVHEYSPQILAPELNLPDDVDWKSIDKCLTEEIMKLPVELFSINKSLSIDVEFAEPDYSEFMYSRQLRFAKFSLKIDLLISKLKKTLKQKPTEYSGNWNPREWCQKFIADHEARTKELEGKK